MFLRGCIELRYIHSCIGGTRFYRRNTSRIIEKIKQDETLGNLVSNAPIENSQDVNSLKNKILTESEMFRPDDIDRSLIIYFTKNKQFNNGLSYIKFLEEDTKKKLNLFLMNQQFIIYFHKRYEDGSLSTSEQEFIVQLYNNLKKNSNILDSLSLENAILGLSVTPNWNLCLTLFNDLKKLENPSSICYSAVIAAAFLNGNEKLAWNLWSEMFAKQKTPYDVIFQAYFENLRKLSDKKKIFTKLEELFETCNENNFILSENSILELQKLSTFSGFKFSDSLVNNNGYCNKCRQKLKNLELTEDEFENLKKKFFEEVIIGKNIFNKTNPAELSKFQEFLKSIKGYNVVIDGLNVAYIAGTKQSPEVYSTLLAKVVSHFVKENKRVIVLGRKHMKTWPKKQWSYIASNALVFLTQDISLDDPYLLYCALHCGKDAILVSRDLMRSHLFALKDPKNKIMFTRWLEQRQFQVTHVRNDGRVFFKNPRPYTRIVQHDNDNWHIPFIVAPEENEEPDKVPEKWLCMKKP